MSLGVWLWLNPKTKGERVMKTIVANKEAGCEANERTAGYALYVNEWETADGQLLLEYGTPATGCAKLGSGEVKVPYGVWFHAGATWADGQVSLYLNGALVDQKDSPKLPQRNTELHLGRPRLGG